MSDATDGQLTDEQKREMDRTVARLVAQHGERLYKIGSSFATIASGIASLGVAKLDEAERVEIAASCNLVFGELVSSLMTPEEVVSAIAIAKQIDSTTEMWAFDRLVKKLGLGHS